MSGCRMTRPMCLLGHKCPSYQIPFLSSSRPFDDFRISRVAWCVVRDETHQAPRQLPRLFLSFSFFIQICTFDVKWNPTVSIADSAASHADSSNGRQDVPSQILLVPRSNLFMPLLTMNYDHLAWDRAPLSVDIGSSRCNPHFAGSNVTSFSVFLIKWRFKRSYLAGSNDDSKSQLRTSIDAQPLIAIKK
ncbi:uncharacterized protein F5891DRAFT_576820 [Suillus fuscotomentosus]|uniref:Uncharacterized protein n=1 Tax=Suillus fuscotomentosus TaxID=1912939 RepID=A0AAD4E005_9AGAM|nr:uncharacterized protein F5891DRAFT_576820 [Suillus fuscotomentosus]KAG1896807.1 hypothetical protein F5891DRAFT_576820 [Suillus fuscotomentosus]